MNVLKENNIPVILKRVHRLPKNEDSKLYSPYEQAKILNDNNITFAFSYAGEMDAMGSRNLPFTAGTAVSYGLKYEKFIALPIPSFHLLIGSIVALESHGAAILLLYASSCSDVTPDKLLARAKAPFAEPPKTV